ncbi:MAG: Rpn family recombination-promoting nuclease/putative transposase [Treponema sp.]|nr:Rpn family recombination-promoting nuclease/putative transposase [Candidatus Treponema equifaecale]
MLNPRLDGIFKTIFTQHTSESQLALRSFLEAILGRKIIRLKLNSNSGIKQFFEQRDVDYDISVTFDDGEQAEIEMQTFSQNYNYQLRAEYLVARLMNSIMKKGFSWKKIKKVHQISILGFISNKNDNEAFHHYVLRSPEGQILSEMLNVYFLELPKLPELTEEMIPQLNTVEKWGIFFRDADNLEKIELVRHVAETEEGIMAAFEILGGISLTQRFWLWQTKKLIKECDRRSDLEGAMEKGITEGQLAAKTEATKKMLSDGVPYEQIAKWQGLSIAEVQEIADKSNQ